MKQTTTQKLAPFLLLALVLVIWEAVCRLFNVSEFIFPSPIQIVGSLIEYFGPIMNHAWRTFWTTMVGFAISIVVGVIAVIMLIIKEFL